MRAANPDRDLTWLDPDVQIGEISLDALLRWGNARPDALTPDIPSVVMLRGPAAAYAADELAALAAFGRRMTAAYDRHAPYRLGCNAILLDRRDDGAWFTTRMTWTPAGRLAPDLPSALAAFELRLPLTGRRLLLDDGRAYLAGLPADLDAGLEIAVEGEGSVPATLLYPLAGGAPIAFDPARDATRVRAIADTASELDRLAALASTPGAVAAVAALVKA